MKISLKWIEDYVDVHEFFNRPDELAALLTAAGLEVEGIENLAKSFQSVVVGCILKKDVHPGADRLTLCQVSTGEGRVHQIVCGARNHNEGDRVVVALPGAVLPGNFAIKLSTIRGVESGGMLCSEKELGLKAESEGILILPTDAPVGKDFAEYMGLDDVVFELKVTPNRADCLSHFGLAREIGCLLGRDVEFPIESFSESRESSRDLIKLALKDSVNCQRYAGRGVRGVKVGPSPDWLKKRLESVGLKSINNVVDVTNYVMFELGQPLHAFDVRELKGAGIVVDRAVPREKFTTLDGTEVTLDGTELTIRDTERVVALAGIVGGLNSGIKDDTADIFIESAYFAPGLVRRTARKFGIETDSAYRFARGVNPDAVTLALNRASQLIQEVAGGQILGHAYDEYPQPIRREPIEIRLDTIASRLGVEVDADQFTKWMTRLGCTVEVKSESASGPVWSVLAPLFRWDLNIDMDLVEEYARLSGYQHLTENIPPLAVAPARHDVGFVREAALRHVLSGVGLFQAINYAFVMRSFQESFLGDLKRISDLGLRTNLAPVTLLNPLNEEINVMRTSLLPGLFKNLMHNSRQSNSFGQIYETGFAHFAEVMESGKKYFQEQRLAFAFWGAAGGLWAKGENKLPVFALKGVIDEMLSSLGAKKWKWKNLERATQVPEFLHPGQAASLEVHGKLIGFIGTLHPKLRTEHKIREEAAVCELNLDLLFAQLKTSVRYQSISKMPRVERDLAFAMPKALPVASVIDDIRKIGGNLLKDVAVFDVFEGGNLAAGQRSVAFRLVFQANDTSLEDQLVNDLSDKIVREVSQNHSISLR